MERQRDYLKLDHPLEIKYQNDPKKELKGFINLLKFLWHPKEYKLEPDEVDYINWELNGTTEFYYP